MKKWLFILSLAAMMTVASLGLAQTQAQSHTQPPVGARVGYTTWDSVNQMHFGGHVKISELLPNVDFTPGVEIGFGSNVTIMTVNGDLAYKFTEFVAAPWGLYGGGSLALNYVNPQGLDSDLDLGLSALLGTTRLLNNGHEVMLEIRIGLMDSPDFKATFGYTFF